MLNRTNRTLSANLNGLNLGTRSLVLATGLNNNVKSTLRARHAHARVHAYSPRDGMFGRFDSGFMQPMQEPQEIAIPEIPCSPPVVRRSVVGRAVDPRAVVVDVVVTVTPGLASWPVALRVPACQADPGQSRNHPPGGPNGSLGTGSRASKPKHWGRGWSSDLTPRSDRATANATAARPAAARFAAAGG